MSSDRFFKLDSGDPASVNNLDAPNMEEKFLTLDSLAEMQNENSELNEQYSIDETGEKTKSSDQKKKSPPQTKTKDILKVGLQLVFHKLVIQSHFGNTV